MQTLDVIGAYCTSKGWKYSRLDGATAGSNSEGRAIFTLGEAASDPATGLAARRRALLGDADSLRAGDALRIRASCGRSAPARP